MPNVISTALMDDPDPEGTDVYGILPLIAEIDDDSEGMGDDDDEEALIEPSSLKIRVRKGEELPDDDDDAYAALTAEGASDLSPGEAEDLIEYMRPLSEDEEEFIETSPLMNDLRWIDDPAHTEDVLKAGKDGRGVDVYLRDAIYGDTMNEDELANRNDSDKFAGWKAMGLIEPQRATQLVAVAKPIPVATRIRYANKTMMNELGQKMIVEHANWLADQDKAQKLPVRPRAFYENVARLWTADKFKKSQVPVSSSGDWSASPRTMIGKANQLLATTEKERSRYSFALGLDDALGGWGWNPIKSFKSAARFAGRSVRSGLKLATKPITYTYKGIKYIGNMAMQLALRPIKALIRRHTGTIANRRALELARQRGLAAPGPAEKAEARTWTKQLVATKGGKYGGVMSSLMGAEYGRLPVDISLGLDDNMGYGWDTLKGLILLGPMAILGILKGLVRLASPSGAPPPPPGSSEASEEATNAPTDEVPPDEGQANEAQPGEVPSPDDGPHLGPPVDAAGATQYRRPTSRNRRLQLQKAQRARLPQAPLPPAEEPAADEPPTEDAPADASGASWFDMMKSRKQHKRKRFGITVEQLNRMNRQKRALMQKLIQAGRIRLV